MVFVCFTLHLKEVFEEEEEEQGSPASSVRVLAVTGLGAPTPTVFFANTLNSYSTQAFSSTTVAVRVLPSITSGTEE